MPLSGTDCMPKQPPFRPGRAAHRRAAPGRAGLPRRDGSRREPVRARIAHSPVTPRGRAPWRRGRTTDMTRQGGLRWVRGWRPGVRRRLRLTGSARARGSRLETIPTSGWQRRPRRQRKALASRMAGHLRGACARARVRRAGLAPVRCLAVDEGLGLGGWLDGGGSRRWIRPRSLCGAAGIRRCGEFGAEGVDGGHPGRDRASPRRRSRRAGTAVGRFAPARGSRSGGPPRRGARRGRGSRSAFRPSGGVAARSHGRPLPPAPRRRGGAGPAGGDARRRGRRQRAAEMSRRRVGVRPPSCGTRLLRRAPVAPQSFASPALRAAGAGGSRPGQYGKWRMKWSRAAGELALT